MRDVVQMEAEVEQKAGEPAGSFARTLAGIVLEQTLVFPTAVVLLASATVLLGGSCAVWQWWASVALTLAWPFWKNRWRAAAAGGGGFLLVLFAVWAVSGITVTREWWDCHSYHYPAMRMLMLGWNPVWESTREAIEAACGQASGLNIWPVLSMPRSVWYFSAVAAFFTKNQFNFYHPVVLFFLFSGIGYAWKALGKTNVFVKLVAAVFVVSVSQVYPHALDMTMALAALGLFACQYSYLRGQAWQTVPLVCFSFWMCSAKQPGIAFCAIAWLAFGAVVLCLEWRERKRVLLRFAKAGGIAAGLFLVANVSPYLTSFVHYGHPLYPQFTADAAKYPRVNFTADFLEVNDDARAMLSSKTAMFLNAYVSPDLVKGFYEWSLDKPGFRPRGQTWKQGGGKDGWDTPLNDASRYWVMIPIVLLIVFGGLAERFVAGVMLLCAIAVPTEKTAQAYANLALAHCCYHLLGEFEPTVFTSLYSELHAHLLADLGLAGLDESVFANRKHYGYLQAILSDPTPLSLWMLLLRERYASWRELCARSGRIAALQKDAADAKSSLAALSAKNGALEGRLAEQRSRLEALENQVEALAAKAAEKDALLARLSGEREGLRARLAAAASANDGLTRQLDAVLNSRSYRLGRLATWPFRWLAKACGLRRDKRQRKGGEAAKRFVMV